MKLLRKGGFTLIELVVVIGIIAVITGIASISLIEWLGKSRDSKRIGDLNTVMTALENYLYTNDSYPLPDNYKTIKYGAGIVGYQGEIGDIFSNKIGMKSKVIDPSSNKPYTYILGRDKNSYQTMTFLENKNQTLSSLKNKVYADDNNTLFVYMLGSKLGALLNPANKLPVEQYFSSGIIDLKTDTTTFLLYLKNTVSINASGSNILTYMDLYRNNIGTYDDTLSMYLSFNEGNGFVSYDGSKNGNNVTIPDKISRTEGVFNKGLYFEGTNTGSVIITNPTLPNTGPLTISVRIHPVSAPVSAAYILDDDLTNNYGFKLNTNLSISSFGNNVGTVQLNKRTNLVAVCNGSSLSFYINGQLSSTSSCSIDSTPNIRIGDSNYMGYIDEIRIYKRSFSATEINLMYEGLK